MRGDAVLIHVLKNVRDSTPPIELKTRDGVDSDKTLTRTHKITHTVGVTSPRDFLSQWPPRRWKNSQASCPT